MVETAEAIHVARPDEDIADDIAALVRRYPPLLQSRHWFAFTIVEGVVTLSGNIKSAIAQRVLTDNLPYIPGVKAVDAKALHNDEEVRIAVGQIVPPGVTIHVDFGRVSVGGKLPPRRKPETLINRIEKVPGVRTVTDKLS